MDTSSITVALNGIKNAIEIARSIKDSQSNLEVAMLKSQMAELINALTDAKIEVADFKELILKKDEEIKEIRKKLEIKENVIWEEPYYFLIKNDGKKEGPFCQKCFDGNQKMIRLQSEAKDGYWICRECKSDYRDSTYKPTHITGPIIPHSGLENLI